jgi:hypothetical protein
MKHYGTSERRTLSQIFTLVGVRFRSTDGVETPLRVTEWLSVTVNVSLFWRETQSVLCGRLNSGHFWSLLLLEFSTCVRYPLFGLCTSLLLYTQTGETGNHHFTWRMLSSGTLRSIILVRTDVSAERRPIIIRVERFGELGKMLAITSNRRTLRRYTRRNFSEDGILHCHRRENLKSYNILLLSSLQ